MKSKEITIDQLQQFKDFVKIDVRSPGEFVDGTIPGAFNIPLLDDAERAQVGTVYKQICTEKAKSMGYDIVKPKLPGIFSHIQSLSENNKNVVLFCWRGGMRSQRLVDYCSEHGLEVSCLSGGYRAYRRLVYSFLNDLEKIPEMVVLMGLTGVGKTKLLSFLAQNDVPIIDIEKVANNRGSVFGQIHGGGQPTQKNFEAMLYENLRSNDWGFSIIECESKRIGKIYLPDMIYHKMKTGVKIHLYADFNKRVERLVEDYGGFPEDKLVDAILHLKKALGQEKTNSLIDLVKKKSLEEVVIILLKDYYDPLYGYPRGQANTYDISINCNNLNAAVKEIMGFLSAKYGFNA